METKEFVELTNEELLSTDGGTFSQWAVDVTVAFLGNVYQYGGRGGGGSRCHIK
jgi:hypothetical protein